MTFNNSVLIIIKQSNGIDYNDLFARILPRYKNPSSATAALARALKDLVSFGLVKKEGTKFSITDKGLATITVEMKEKLVLRLNENLKKSFPDPEELARLLVVLTQRASMDSALLTTAKENASFTLRDLESVRKKLKERRRFLKQMGTLIEEQEKKLRDLDFNDSLELSLNEELFSKIRLFAGAQKVVVETRDEEVLSKVPENWKKQGLITVESDSFELLSQLLASRPSIKATLYLPGIKISLAAGKAICFGSCKALKGFAGAPSVPAENKKVEQSSK